MSRVNPKTMICDPHNVEGCIVCMTDDAYDWRDAQIELRRQYKRDWAATPIEERFDLGGEG